MAPVYQDTSAGQRNVTQGSSAALFHTQEDTKGTYDDIVTLVEALENKVCALKSRSDMLEKIIKNLQSKCDMHERTLETFRQHIVDLHRYQETLDLSYQREEFESVS